MKPAYMEAAQELNSKNVCIHITQLGEKLLFQTLTRTQCNHTKRKIVATQHGGGRGGGNGSESQVDPSSLLSVMLSWQSTCTGVDNLIIDGERQARIKCSVQ